MGKEQKIEKLGKFGKRKFKPQKIMGKIPKLVKINKKIENN